MKCEWFHDDVRARFPVCDLDVFSLVKDAKVREIGDARMEGARGLVLDRLQPDFFLLLGLRFVRLHAGRVGRGATQIFRSVT